MIPLLHPRLDLNLLAAMDDCPSAQVDWLIDRYSDLPEQPEIAKPSVLACDLALMFGQGCVPLHRSGHPCETCGEPATYICDVWYRCEAHKNHQAVPLLWHLPQASLALWAGLQETTCDKCNGEGFIEWDGGEAWGKNSCYACDGHGRWRADNRRKQVETFKIGKVHEDGGIAWGVETPTGIGQSYDLPRAEREWRRRVLGLFPEIKRLMETDLDVTYMDASIRKYRTWVDARDFVPPEPASRYDEQVESQLAAMGMVLSRSDVRRMYGLPDIA